MVLVHRPSPDCHLSINQVPFQSLLYFPRYGPDTHPYYEKKKWLWGDNTVNIQGRIMVLGFCPFPHCRLSKLFGTRQTDGQTDKAATICFPLWGA